MADIFWAASLFINDCFVSLVILGALALNIDNEFYCLVLSELILLILRLLFLPSYVAGLVLIGTFAILPKFLAMLFIVLGFIG